MMDVFYLLKTKTGIELEHPILSELHQCLVIEANFELAQQILKEAHEQRNLFKPYSENAKYTPSWQQIETSEDRPSARGGHQMCIDVEDEMIYILGGWDGKQDLSDFWCFDITRNRWHLLSLDTQL